MSLRRYSDLKPSRGTEWPKDVRLAAYALMPQCIGPAVGMPESCWGSLELDHIRASGAVGRKSRSKLDNAARLCPIHHRVKERDGRYWRPRLIAFVANLIDPHSLHVDPVAGCEPCYQATRRAPTP